MIFGRRRLQQSAYRFRLPVKFMKGHLREEEKASRSYLHCCAGKATTINMLPPEPTVSKSRSTPTTALGAHVLCFHLQLL